MASMINPQPFMKGLIDHEVVVRLKWGMEYVGTLVAFDQRYNLHLQNCEEWIGQKSIKLGDLLIRCNNILHIREKPDIYPPEIKRPDEESIINEDEDQT